MDWIDLTHIRSTAHRTRRTPYIIHAPLTAAFAVSEDDAGDPVVDESGEQAAAEAMGDGHGTQHRRPGQLDQQGRLRQAA